MKSSGFMRLPTSSGATAAEASATAGETTTSAERSATRRAAGITATAAVGEHGVEQPIPHAVVVAPVAVGGIGMRTGNPLEDDGEKDD